jgi:hypothetical protein
MAYSTEAKQLRKQLALDGINDPFALLAEAIERNERLQEKVRMLEAIVCRQA